MGEFFFIHRLFFLGLFPRGGFLRLFPVGLAETGRLGQRFRLRLGLPQRPAPFALPQNAHAVVILAQGAGDLRLLSAALGAAAFSAVAGRVLRLQPFRLGRQGFRFLLGEGLKSVLVYPARAAVSLSVFGPSARAFGIALPGRSISFLCCGRTFQKKSLSSFLSVPVVAVGIVKILIRGKRVDIGGTARAAHGAAVRHEGTHVGAVAPQHAVFPHAAQPCCLLFGPFLPFRVVDHAFFGGPDAHGGIAHPAVGGELRPLRVGGGFAVHIPHVLRHFFLNAPVHGPGVRRVIGVADRGVLIFHPLTVAGLVRPVREVDAPEGRHVRGVFAQVFMQQLAEFRVEGPVLIQDAGENFINGLVLRIAAGRYAVVGIFIRHSFSPSSFF